MDRGRHLRPRVRQRQPAVGARSPGRVGPLVGRAAPGGHLAVQVPANSDHPSHRLATEVASTEPFRTAIGDLPHDQVAANVLAPEQYAILLDHLGAADQHVRLTVYGHRLDSSADVVEWVKGTNLRRILAVLPSRTA